MTWGSPWEEEIDKRSWVNWGWQGVKGEGMGAQGIRMVKLRVGWREKVMKEIF